MFEISRTVNWSWPRAAKILTVLTSRSLRRLFALRLEDAGFDRATIIAALSTDKADLSRYITVARGIPLNLATQIGPASKAGRSRWVALAEGLGKPKATDAIEAMLGSEQFKQSDSDTRFNLIFNAVSRPPAKTPKGKGLEHAKGEKGSDDPTRNWTNSSGFRRETGANFWRICR